MEVVCPVCGKTYRIPEERFSGPVIKGRCSQCRSILNIRKENGEALVAAKKSALPESHEIESPPDTASDGTESSGAGGPGSVEDPGPAEGAEVPSSEPSPVYPGPTSEKRERDYKAILVFLIAFLALVTVAILGVRSVERSTLFNQLKSISRITGIFDETAQKAREKFKKKQRRPRNRYQKHMTRAHQNFQEKKYDKALDQYNLAISSDPGKYIAYYWRGQVFARQKAHDKAIEDMNKVLELNPSYSKAHKMLGWIYCEARRYDEAIQALDRYIEVDPKDGWSYFERGLCYYKKGDLATALKDAKKACDLGYKAGCEVYKRYQKG